MGKNLNQLPDDFNIPKNSHMGDLNGEKLTIGIVCAKFNQQITGALLMGAMQGLTDNKVKESNITTVWVPGAFEVPTAMNILFPKVDCIIAIACIIKGGTPHFDYVCQGITHGINLANQAHKKPGIFCVLTTNTIKQAEERAKPNSSNNKGYEAALAAIEMGTLNLNG